MLKGDEVQKYINDLRNEWESPMTKDEALKLIPPGSIILVKTVERLKFSNVFQKLILWWGKHVERETYVCNHAALYFGSGNHEIVEANGGLIRIRKVDQFLYPYNQVYFFHNINTTVENLQKGKDEAYKRVFRRKGLDISGRVYDFGELFRFAFPAIPDNKNADICSRLVWDIEKIMKNPMVTEDEHDRISPARIIDWLIDTICARQRWTGVVDTGWRCSCVWDRNIFTGLEDVI